VLFANWVIASERRSFAVAARTAPAEPAPVRSEGLPADPPVPAATDATGGDAEEAVRLAVEAARSVAADDGFLAATPARLGELRPGYLYVDGPSTTAGVVSVAASSDAWAAAALGPDGTCRWAALTGDGIAAGLAEIRCTGAAALAALDVG
ncbi:MAG TPA: hypothetical protein VFQ40_07030, partial [Actinomycetota bacterium]|nr:hypothetical protein [Actinomycetota bacterium]